APFRDDTWAQMRLQRGSRFIVKNWQRQGQDYRLVFPEQMADTLAFPSFGPQPELGAEFDCPQAGLTVRDCAAKFGGLAFAGESVEQSNFAQIPGVFMWDSSNGGDYPDRGGLHATKLVPWGMAIGAAPAAFGPPKAILTWPRADAPADVRQSDMTL